MFKDQENWMLCRDDVESAETMEELDCWYCQMFVFFWWKCCLNIIRAFSHFLILGSSQFVIFIIRAFSHFIFSDAFFWRYVSYIIRYLVVARFVHYSVCGECYGQGSQGVPLPQWCLLAAGARLLV